MNQTARIATIALSLAATRGLAGQQAEPVPATPAPEAKAEAGSGAPAWSVLAGHWTVNAELSDDVREKMRQSRPQGGGPPRGPMGGPPPGGGPGGGSAGGRGGGFPGGRGGRPPGAAPMAALTARDLTIEALANEIVIIERSTNRDGDEETRVRRLDPTGRKVKHEGGALESRSTWKDGALVVETKGDRGRSTETYRVESDRRLKLVARVEMSRPGGSPLEVERVFDPATPAGAPAPEPAASPMP